MHYSTWYIATCKLTESYTLCTHLNFIHRMAQRVLAMQVPNGTKVALNILTIFTTMNNNNSHEYSH